MKLIIIFINTNIQIYLINFIKIFSFMLIFFLSIFNSNTQPNELYHH
jgi:hypothetical protein